MLPIGSSNRRLLNQSTHSRVSEFHVSEVAPGTSRSDDLGFEESDNRFGQRVVVGVTDAAHRGLDAGFGETLGVVDRDVLYAAVAVMDKPVVLRACVQGLFQGIQCQIAAESA